MRASAKSSKPSETPEPPKTLTEKAAEGVRKSPVQSVVWAFFIGLFFTIFPVGRVLGALTSLALALLRPVLVILGAVKLFEEIEERRK